MPGENRVIREGVMVGLVAYMAVAAFYAMFDLLAARGPLYTVNLLGLAVFDGTRGLSITQGPITMDLSGILWYNALHLVFSLVIGLIVVRLIAEAERHPGRARLVLYTIIGGFVVTILAVGQLTEPIRPMLPFWSIVLANLLAVLFAGWYLLRWHPGIWGRLTA